MIKALLALVFVLIVASVASAQWITHFTPRRAYVPVQTVPIETVYAVPQTYYYVPLVRYYQPVPVYQSPCHGGVCLPRRSVLKYYW